MKIGKWDYIRCNRDLPCPLCGRIKYCMITPDGSAVICTKVAEGAKRSYSYGHLHFINEVSARPKITRKPVHIKADKTKVYAVYKTLEFSCNDLLPMAKDLGVRPHSLKLMGVGARSGVWYFPMYNEKSQMIGLKCRNLKHQKWCVKHSKLGVYMAQTFNPILPLMICEGESDTAALIELGYNAVGRPSATSGGAILDRLVNGNKFVYVFADTDKSGLGLESAVSLAKRLNGKVVYNPYHKDVRDWIAAGGFRNNDWMKRILT